MDKYIVKVREHFTADVEVEADNMEEAKDKVKTDGIAVSTTKVHWDHNPDTFEVEEAYKKENYM